MAKPRRSSKHPQPNHKKKSSSSQFDKRERLDNPNPDRSKTMRPKVPLVGHLAVIVGAMTGMLDPRMAFRLPIIMAGMMLASGRRVAASWFASAGVKQDWDRFYACLISVGQRAQSLAMPLASAVIRKFDPGDNGRLTVAIDDSPTARYGRHVEGAGVHHHPTPGPADGPWMYGHNWVSLNLIAQHASWGVIALPLLSRLYVRVMDIPKLKAKYGWEFRTKHELALELATWFVTGVRGLGLKCKIWLAMDGAYVGHELLDGLRKLDVVVVSRLRKDAVLFDLPTERQPKQRGRPRVYGTNRISLSKRAAHRDGWQPITYHCRSREVTRLCKTFLCTSPTVRGVIRVAIVRFEDGGWAAYFCTDPTAEAHDILETAAARWPIEEHFHDLKEIWGAGQQQVRNVWSNIGCWHLNQWMYTLVELCSWDVPKAELTDRSDRSWDNPERRPSHADRRRAITKEMLEKQFLVGLPEPLNTRKFRRLIEELISLSA